MYVFRCPSTDESPNPAEILSRGLSRNWLAVHNLRHRSHRGNIVLLKYGHTQNQNQQIRGSGAPEGSSSGCGEPKVRQMVTGLIPCD